MLMMNYCLEHFFFNLLILRYGLKFATLMPDCHIGAVIAEIAKIALKL